jgi:hypothetical protein
MPSPTLSAHDKKFTGDSAPTQMNQSPLSQQEGQPTAVRSFQCDKIFNHFITLGLQRGNIA